jgi:FG-GAP-like repeat
MTAISWKAPVDGNWNVAANWSTGAVPTSTDDVTIAAPGSYTVTISSNRRLPLGGLLAAVQLGGGSEANSLTFNAPQAALEENAGALDVAGALTVNSGLVSLNETNTIGSVGLTGGVLAFGAADALGNPADQPSGVTVSGGELLATANETLSNALTFTGTSTIAAAHGTTLSLSQGDLTIDAHSTLNFGAIGQDGVILWNVSGFGLGIGITVNVVSGTLKAASSGVDAVITSSSQPTTVDAGATLDAGGFDLDLNNLLGAGTVTDSDAAATLTLDAANFSGTISGALSLALNGNASLSGLEDYTGGAFISGADTLANTGAYDIVSNNGIAGAPDSAFINNSGGLFEKTAGGGVSDVTTDFVNEGALNVLSGSVKFSGGFTNNGVIHGLVTQSGGVTTVSAAVPSDFNGDTLSDILWQNADGQASIWDMNANALTGGGGVSPNPGSSWKAIGTGDFNGDGHADILWQNADGQASIWAMNGKSLIGGGPVSPNPGPAWQAIASGDFNGDGLSDILFQNTSSGQVSIWEMNGNKLIGGGPVSPNPGPAWKAIGTGDFNGDGFSDILFQNTSTGQVSIWEMDGNKLIGGGPVSPNPGPAWKAIGTGDFNDDEHSDILFQNASTGQVSVWEMNGSTLTGGGPVSPNPGPTWHAVGTGDFNDDGHSDILFQNASGQASVWEMNGASLVGGGAVSANPGASWRAVA